MIEKDEEVPKNDSSECGSGEEQVSVSKIETKAIVNSLEGRASRARSRGRWSLIGLIGTTLIFIGLLLFVSQGFLGLGQALLRKYELEAYEKKLESMGIRKTELNKEAEALSQKLSEVKVQLNRLNNEETIKKRVYLTCIASTGTGWLTAAGEDGYAFVSKNDGEDWKRIFNLGEADINYALFLNENIGFLVGSNGSVFRSESRGSSWSMQKIESKTDFERVRFWENSGVGIIYGRGTDILVTSDSGKSWELKETSFHRVKGVHFWNKDHFFLWGEPDHVKDSAVLVTEDRGKTWSSIQSYKKFSLSHAEVTGDGTVFLFTQGKLFRTDQAFGVPIEYEMPTIQSIEDAHFITSELGFCVGRNGVALRTVNGGEKWTYLKHDFSGSDLSMINVTEEQDGIIIGTPNIYYTKDGGETWSLSYEDVYSTISVDSPEPEERFYVNRGELQVAKSSNFGSSWDEIFLPGSSSQPDEKRLSYEAELAEMKTALIDEGKKVQEELSVKKDEVKALDLKIQGVEERPTVLTIKVSEKVNTITTVTAIGGAIGLFFYLMQIFFSRMRYYNRLAEYYDSQGDCLHAGGGDPKLTFQLLEKLSPLVVEPGKMPSHLYDRLINSLTNVYRKE